MAYQAIRLNNLKGLRDGTCESGSELSYGAAAVNMDTAGGLLKRCGGFSAVLPAAIMTHTKLRRFYIWARETGDPNCIVLGEDNIDQFFIASRSWGDAYHYCNGSMSSDRFDFLRAKIGDTEWLLIANGLEPILKWDGVSNSVESFGSAQGLSNVSVNFLELYYGRLFAAGDPEHPARLYWSKAPGESRTIEDWSADADGENVSGGSVEVGTDSDPITGVFAMSNQLLIFKKDRLYRLLGDRPSNYRILPVDASLTQPVHTACVLHGDRLFFLTDSGLYFFDGQTVRRTAHGGDIKGLLQRADFSMAAAASCKDKLYFALRLQADSVFNDTLIEYDVLRDCFLLRQGFETVDMQSCHGKLYLLTGTGKTVLLDGSDSYDGAPIEACWETPYLDLGSGLTDKKLLELCLTGAGAAAVSVRWEDGEYGGVYALEGEAAPGVLPLKGGGRRIKLRIENVGGGGLSLFAGPELLLDVQKKIL